LKHYFTVEKGKGGKEGGKKKSCQVEGQNTAWTVWVRDGVDTQKTAKRKEGGPTKREPGKAEEKQAEGLKLTNAKGEKKKGTKSHLGEPMRTSSGENGKDRGGGTNTLKIQMGKNFKEPRKSGNHR